MRFSSKAPRTRQPARPTSTLIADCVYRYRPASNRSFTITQPSSRHATQMMYPYGNVPLQPQQPQAMQQHQQHQQQHHPHSRPSPPYPTWAVPQTHNPYAHMQKTSVEGSRDDYQPLAARTDPATSQSPALSNAHFRNTMGGQETLGTDYFPGVIDTSR
jgi:hypothetical protein